jgi:hypothetical protein
MKTVRIAKYVFTSKQESNVKIKKRIGEAECFPRYYGLAYRYADASGWYLICYPMPLNLLMRLLWHIFVWVRCPPPSHDEKLILKTAHEVRFGRPEGND